MPKGYSKRNQGGWKHSSESKSLIAHNRSGLTANEQNPRWMGDNVSYAALHNWVRNHYKKPDKCESCKLNPGLNKRGHTKLQWANRDKKYLRNRKDWICLCAKCHKQYDVKNKASHKYSQRI